VARDSGKIAVGISVQAEFPCEWSPLASPPDAAVLRATAAHNERLLRVVTILNESFPATGEFDAASNQELARIDQKFNLLIELVGELLVRQSPVPADRQLELSMFGAAWAADTQSIELGSYGWLRLVLHTSYPKLLELPSQVVSVDDAKVSIKFLDLGESVYGYLEKLLFRYHRRSVARHRQS